MSTTDMSTTPSATDAGLVPLADRLRYMQVFRFTDAGLVPLADRLRYMQVFRFTAAGTALLAWILLPAQRVVGLEPLLLALAGFLALAGLTRSLWRLERTRAVRVFGLSLLADGVFLAFFSYVAVGFGNPLQYLVVLHLVTVTLLASFRTGAKLAVWHSLVATAVMQLQWDGLLPHMGGGPRSIGLEVFLFLVVVWLVTLLTASFAAVNERELRRRNYDLQALAQLSWQLESALHPHEVAETLVEAAAYDFDLERAALLVAGPDGLTPLAGRGLRGVAGSAGSDLLVEQSLRERRTLRLGNPRADQHPWMAAAMPGAGNVLCLPMYADGAPLGVLLLELPGGRAARVERRAVEMLERFVSQAALALANARLLAQVRTLAAADGLTGVANRRTFDARLTQEIERSVRSGQPVSLVLFDVDHFKRLNDTYGHQAGDETLQRVAATLQASARSVDLVARYGGEEFALVLPGATAAAAAEAAERLRQAIAAMPGEPTVTASLGVADFPLTALNATELIAAADEALYAAKQDGRNRVRRTTRRSPASPAVVAGGSVPSIPPARSPVA